MLKFLNKNRVNQKKKYFSNKKEAFTLPEVIISIAVLSMVITSATSILTSVLRTNSVNANSVIAYGIAQEGLEAIRNIRDSNYILGLDFAGKNPHVESQDSVWGASLFESENVPKYFILERNEIVESEDSCSSENLSNCVPFKLQEITINNGDNLGILNILSNENIKNQTAVYLKEELKTASDSDTTTTIKTFLQGVNLDNEENLKATAFRRIIRIEPLAIRNNDNTVDVLRVSVIVTWYNVASNQDRNLVLTTDLTNWKDA